MPCRIPSHKHDWPRSGTLSISKCEFKCAFCSSTKEYKPASALRKHVLTHIKNDKMPLNLDKSTGGRPRLQTTAIDPSSRDQPETHPPSPELTLTSGPVLGTLNTQGDTIKTIDDIVLSIKNMFSREDINSLYSQRCGRVPDALKIVEAAVGFSKTFGPEKKLIRRGLECLRMFMADIFHIFTGDFNSCPSISTKFNQYTAFHRALTHTAWINGHTQFSTISMMVLETFYATWILPLILRFNYAHQGGSVDSSSFWPIRYEIEVKPLLLSFEGWNMTLDDLCDEVYRANLPEYLKHTHIRDKEVASGLYRKSIFGPADSLPRVVRERSLGESGRLLIEDLESTCIR